MAGGAISFSRRVKEVVKMVPKGKVVSYGQVALYAGYPRGARSVGRILRQTRDNLLPWWRVINNRGYISIKGNWEHEAEEQRELLRKEGVDVSDRFEIEIERYRYLAK
jgi:methylated-DNA-protein-cysteine methyltransferase-like protein